MATQRRSHEPGPRHHEPSIEPSIEPGRAPPAGRGWRNHRARPACRAPAARHRRGPAGVRPGGPADRDRSRHLLARRPRGASVAVADLDLAAATETVDRIAAEGGTAIALAGDAADDKQAPCLVAQAAEALGGLDALTVNTGIAYGLGLAGTSG
ncbi:MAG: SDR family oxidoreductase, partial [Geodermatophilaceae bacterium]